MTKLEAINEVIELIVEDPYKFGVKNVEKLLPKLEEIARDIRRENRKAVKKDGTNRNKKTKARKKTRL